MFNRFQKYLTKCEVPHILSGVRKGADQAKWIPDRQVIKISDKVKIKERKSSQNCFKAINKYVVLASLKGHEKCNILS